MFCNEWLIESLVMCSSLFLIPHPTLKSLVGKRCLLLLLLFFVWNPIERSSFTVKETIPTSFLKTLSEEVNDKDLAVNLVSPPIEKIRDLSRWSSLMMKTSDPVDRIRRIHFIARFFVISKIFSLFKDRSRPVENQVTLLVKRCILWSHHLSTRSYLSRRRRTEIDLFQRRSHIRRLGSNQWDFIWRCDHMSQSPLSNDSIDCRPSRWSLIILDTVFDLRMGSVSNNAIVLLFHRIPIVGIRLSNSVLVRVRRISNV